MNQRHDQHIAFSEWVCSASTRSVWSCSYRKVRLPFFSYTYRHLVLAVNLPLLTIPLR